MVIIAYRTESCVAIKYENTKGEMSRTIPAYMSIVKHEAIRGKCFDVSRYDLLKRTLKIIVTVRKKG